MKLRLLLRLVSGVGWILVATVGRVSGGGLQPLGFEFQVTRNVPGDQVNPAMALGAAGGVVLWQDAAIDGQGLGIACTRLGPDGKALNRGILQVNETTADDQENPAVVSLPNGGALAVWQGGRQGFQRIYGRVLGPDTGFLTSEFAVSSGASEHQIDPAMAVLEDGSVVVAWSSYRQDGSDAYDVYGRVFSSSGTPRGDEFRINSTFGLNRRTPAVAALGQDRFLVIWISESQIGIRNNRDSQGRVLRGTGAPDFDVTAVANVFTGDGQAAGAERQISSSDAFASNPCALTLPNGGVAVAWTRRLRTQRSTVGDRLDVAGRFLDSSGAPISEERRINQVLAGDQFRPRLAFSRYGILAIWTGFGRDGSREGVFGRWIDNDGLPVGEDLQVNTQTGGGQIFPAVAVNSAGDFLVAWSSNLPRSGYEIFAQQLIPLQLNVRPGPAGGLRLEWPTVAGGVYQLQLSTDGLAWLDLGGTRSASAASDSIEIAALGQMVLYRVVRQP